jgi:periplasmic divalent cation tolerance protein
MDTDKPVLVYATFPSLAAAEAMGARLVEQRLAACVNIIPEMVAIYRWEGKLERGAEVVMIVKTRESLARRVMDAVRAEHEYQTPALLVLPVLDGSAEYCRWIVDETA